MPFAVGTMSLDPICEAGLPPLRDGRHGSADSGEVFSRPVDFTAVLPLPATVLAWFSLPRSAIRIPRRAAITAALGAVLVTALLSNCESLSPSGAMRHPDIQVPEHWITGEARQPDQFPDHHWIGTFRAPDLSAFVESVMAGNRDLKAAQSRIEIAGANARIAGADLYPQITGNFPGQRSSQNFIGLPLPGAPPGSVLSSQSNRFGLSLDLQWEIDLWGRIRSARAAVVADFEASAYDFSTAQLSLAGQAAKTWFALAEAKDQVALARSAIATFSGTESAIRERFERGIGDNGQNFASELLLAEADVANARDALAAREELAGRSARQLEILAGSYPLGTVGKSAKLPELPGQVPAGLPATLLDRRPDLAAAERRIAAADKRLLEAKRSLLPAVSLTGSYGSASEDISDLLNGDFSVWSLAGNLAQPILRGGRLRTNISKREAELSVAAAEFEQAALTAFSEVENALAAEAFLTRRVGSLAEASRLALAAYRRSLEAFELGTGDILTVLAAQQRLFTSRSQWISIRRQRLDNRVDLHLALGGSFRPTEPPLDTSTEP